MEKRSAEVLDSKIDKRYWHCPLWYYLQWAGYEGTANEFTWVAADELHADELVPAFHAHYSHKPDSLESL